MEDRFKFRCFWKDDKQMYYFDNYCMPHITKEDEKIAHIMQCTGLKDKNGKLIYEKDILEQSDGIKDYVYWSDGCYIHNGTAITNYDTCYQGDKWAKEVNTHKVIGNIYENPELLEANND